ncbi:MAG: undecaprenyl/decaprenyl-phosphate alpha-N-acetylglucosaminyl 1-phosphate transferase [Coriobacteriales bacterium]|nr:undecaprenyl/decaprenyl-phosphate alpha-N-acetylglucosaminyl 1-phosphate transferase [Coriobacteriales bacterium]
MNVWQYIGLIATAAAVTLIVTPLVRWVALRFGLVDRPGGRKVHSVPIPRIGGIGIFAGVMAALGLEWAGELFFGWGGGLSGAAELRLFGVIGGMLAIFTVGLLDDIFDLKPGLKFLGQLFSAAIVVAANLHLYNGLGNIKFVGNPLGGGLVLLGVLSVPVTLLYILGFTNVINLIDGLDGLASGVSAIAGMSLLVLAVESKNLAAAALAAALVGACLGFLRYNFNPASIFMGDSGALFLGFTLACISLLGVMKSVATIALAVPLMIIGVPIFDTSSAIIRRVLHRRPIQEADKGHIHHRLLGRGFDQRQTVLIIYLWSIALAIAAYAIRYAPGPIKLAAFFALFVVTGFMAYWLGLFEAAHHLAHDMGDKKGAQSAGASPEAPAVAAPPEDVTEASS